MIANLVSFSPIISKYFTYFSRGRSRTFRTKSLRIASKDGLIFCLHTASTMHRLMPNASPTCSLVHGSMIHVDSFCSHRS